MKRRGFLASLFALPAAAKAVADSLNGSNNDDGAMIYFDVCWTGRRWLNIGSGFIAIGFGPNRLIERIYIFKKMVYPKG